MEFDPIGNAQSIPDMIKNDTLIEALDQDQLSAEIKQNSQKSATISKTLIKSQVDNKNIEELKNISKIEDNFDKIYKICKRIARTNDKEAMSFAIRERFVYVTEKGETKYKNIFTKAVEDNEQILIRLLIGFDIDINSRDKGNDTALTWASYYDHHEVVKLLLTAPAIYVNTKNIYGNTALILASSYGHYEVVKLLLTVPGIDVNIKADNKDTALICASLWGYHEVVKLLLAVPEIDVNAKNNYNYTALILASSYGHYEVVKLLLTVPGIDVNAKDKWNNTALMKASRYDDDHHEVVKLLKAHGAL